MNDDSWVRTMAYGVLGVIGIILIVCYYADIQDGKTDCERRGGIYVQTGGEYGPWKCLKEIK